MSARAVAHVRRTISPATPRRQSHSIDRRLADPGSLDTRGIALRDALFGPDQELIDALASLEPLPQGAASAAVWEPIGPHAVDAPRDAGRVGRSLLIRPLCRAPCAAWGPRQGPWSSGYDGALTQRKSPVQIRLGPLPLRNNG